MNSGLKIALKTIVYCAVVYIGMTYFFAPIIKGFANTNESGSHAANTTRSDGGKAKAETLVASQMKDPDSAVFRYMQQSKTQPSHWCGQVNARNAYGGMAGYEIFLVNIDTGEVMMGESIMYKPEADGFCK